MKHPPPQAGVLRRSLKTSFTILTRALWRGGVRPMLGLLPLVTSYAARKRHLGYRRITPLDATLFASSMTAHEFHYASIVSEGAADRLFAAEDALRTSLGDVGLRRGNVAGSFMHLIDIRDGAA